MKPSRLALPLCLLAAYCCAQGMDDDMSAPPEGGRPGRHGMQMQQQCTPAAEEPQMVSPKPKPAFWYFCTESKMFYPYVQACPSGWKIVPAQPPENGELPLHSAG